MAVFAAPAHAGYAAVTFSASTSPILRTLMLLRALAFVAAIAVVGCAATPAASPIVAASGEVLSSMAPATPGSTTPTAEPTVSALSITELAAAYLVCADDGNARTKALNKEFDGVTTLKAAKALWRKFADVDGDFILCITSIAWTPKFDADVRDVLKAVAAVQVTELVMAAKGTSEAEYQTLKKTLDKQVLASSSASNLLRVNLGLPTPGAY